MKYEVILFDADDTLLDFKKSEEYAFERTISEFDIKYYRNYHYKTYKNINKKVWEELEKGLILVEDVKIERFKRFTKKLNISVDPEELNKTYLDFLSKTSFLIEGSNEILSSLSDKYRLCIITNGFADVQNKRIRNSNLNNYFEEIIISEEANASKPDPKIFEYTFKMLNLQDKSSVLIVGDSLTSDIKGGVNFGIDTCWYNPDNETNKSDVHPKYEINKLNELNDIL
ncbi:YjjG family noncanonical pyrimidine nucleotidase [Clostridium sediminicola]|uniref:YjjG family noncanonical pyrimidine nucleotidase n=1 Tax=Clostridium sediminicola TaxID=3114879 RepID=UPI0031F26C80